MAVLEERSTYYVIMHYCISRIQNILVNQFRYMGAAILFLESVVSVYVYYLDKCFRNIVTHVIIADQITFHELRFSAKTMTVSK